MNIILSLLLSLSAFAAPTDYNQMVLDAIASMPKGGGFSRGQDGEEAIKRGAYYENGTIVVTPQNATPSYCTGASYLVFLKVIVELQKRGLGLSPDALKAMLMTGQPDGTDVWGRWNSNGPGTSRLFFELGLGKNFLDWKQAKAGDFMKIFWNNHVGKLERGHSVVYLGTELKNGVEMVRFYSSDPPVGFGSRSVEKSTIIRAVFSRLTNPKGLESILVVPRSDPYLASLLTYESNWNELLEKIGLKK